MREQLSILKTAIVRDLRNRYSSLLSWIEAGEEIVITQRGKVVAQLIPEHDQPVLPVDWSQSPAVQQDRSGSQSLTAEESLEIVYEACGTW